MKKTNEVRFFITDVVAIELVHILKKSDAYRQATGKGWGVVDTDKDGVLFCDEDSSATLIMTNGKQCCIYPYEELNRKEWPKQAECVAIIISDSASCYYWEKEKGLVQIFVSYDEDGYVDTFRLGDWTDKPCDGESVIFFEDLPDENPYLKC